MNLDLFNNLLNNTKENGFVQNFLKELSNYLEKPKINNQERNNSLKQENNLYQVVELDTDGVYLQNTNDNTISKETDIPKEILEKVQNDSVLKYKNGKYIYEEEKTQDFLDSLIGIRKYEDIKNKFIKESNILKIDSDVKYKFQERNDKYSILKYGNNEENYIKVPNELIPYWSNNQSILYYKDGKFNRDN